MRRRVVILAAILLATTAGAHDHRYTLGVRGGVATLTGGHPDSAKFTLQNSFGITFSYAFKERWLLVSDLSRYRLHDDPAAQSSFDFDGDENSATRTWKTTRIAVGLRRCLFAPGSLLNMTLGLGGGMMIWKYVDPQSDTILNIRGARNEEVDFAASEIFITAGGGIELALGRHLSLSWDVTADHLTTAGAEFQTGVNSARPRWLIGSFLALSFSFGQSGFERRQRLYERTPVPPTRQIAAVRDRDGDGVSDRADDCPGTPRGIIVDEKGCAVDRDGDGVSDDQDDCPNTEPRARRTVDIFGCAIDSDFDGVPDYLDACPFNQIGGQVDPEGCSIDSDQDGVPDGLDDCPNTLYGVEVDRYGCIDLSMLSKPLVLNVDYAPGSFEIDPVNLEKVKKLARLLKFIPDIKLEISGYTDNIGTAIANKLLSEKRARRVGDYLVAMDIAADRIKVFGRGETSFVASNQTAQGRATNRRVEIVFYR